VKNWTTFVGGTWSDTQTTKSWPAFWRVNFASPLKAGVFATVGLNTTGLSSGSVWLNGHNLGRFSGNTLLYMPEAWLVADNTLVVYDASGNAPSSVKLSYFETRGRYPYSAGAGGTGGTNGTGGSTSVGGAAGVGGATSFGGATGFGGAKNQGGSIGTTSGTATQGGSTGTNGGSASRGGMTSAGGTLGTSIAVASGGSGNTGGTRAATGGSGNNPAAGGLGASAGGNSANSAVGDATQPSSSGCSCSIPESKRRSGAFVLLFGCAFMAAIRRKKAERRQLV